VDNKTVVIDFWSNIIQSQIIHLKIMAGRGDYVRKILIATLATLGIFVLMPVTAMAANPGCVTGGICSNVAGTVSNSSGVPVSGANVSVNCDGYILTQTTSGGGGYQVSFDAGKCPDSSTAVVTATKGNASGTKSGEIYNLTSTINLAIVNVSFVPELGVITGIAAVTLGGGAFLVIRRQNLSSHKL